MSIFGPSPAVSAGAAANVIQRVVLFYWNPATDSWGAYENGEEPVGHTIYQGQPSESEFDWGRWRDDPAYKQWWQEQLGGAPAEYRENAQQDQAPAAAAPANAAAPAAAAAAAAAPAAAAPADAAAAAPAAAVPADAAAAAPADAAPAAAAAAAPALVFGAPAAIAGGYRQIDVTLQGAVVGRARYSAAERPIPGGDQSGIELSEVFVEADQRNHGYSTLILNHVLQVIGLNRKVWLDAQSQGGLSQASLVNWYGRHGFEATGNGNIMATVDFL
ncbi:MAG TPA: hypothetical protein VH988_08580 [Thermoanaerobaculia bacterium]|nr:hypothetical protein [Thermoanaerobaculia bacterium]